MRSLLWLTKSYNVQKYSGSQTDSSALTDGPLKPRDRLRSVYMAGHSCGAHILSNLVFLLPGVPRRKAQTAITLEYPPPPMPAPSSTSIAPHEEKELLTLLQTKVKGLGFLDGILDLVSLIDQYPDYADFVRGAFGEPGEGIENWIKPSVPLLKSREVPDEIRRLLAHGTAAGLKLIVGHANDDELLTPRQSQEWFEWLEETFGRSSNLVYDGTTLVGTHDGCLQHPGVGKLLATLMNGMG